MAQTNGNDKIANPFARLTDDSYVNYEVGLSKREYFSAMAMHGLMANSAVINNSDEILAKYAVNAADALIAELNRQS